MASLRYAAIRGMFEVLRGTGVTAVIRTFSRARGVIFTLHRVLPEKPAAFSPNRILQVTPGFLNQVIRRMRKLGYDIVSLDEAVRRLRSTTRQKPFVVFTFDDGYRDNLVHALPVLRANECPFTLYVPTALVDGLGEVWWQALEDIIAKQKAIALETATGTDFIPTESTAEKEACYNRLYGMMRSMPERDRVAFIRDLARKYGFDLDAHCRSLIMDWNELKTFAEEPLCTIGAHTVHHYELAKLSPQKARQEVEQSLDVIERQFGTRPTHLSYPIGAPVSAGPREYQSAAELGLLTGVTTIPGALYAGHGEKLTSLPRVSLNGLFQARRYIDVFGTPAVFTLLGR